MAELEKRYFKVVAKCGHVGKKKYIPIAFGICAENGKEAASITRKIGRVKHHHKDAILSCCEISYEQYLTIQEINNNDPYLKCKNVQEQSQIDLSTRLVVDHHSDEIEYDMQERMARVNRKIKLNKIIEKSYRGERYECCY